MSDFNKLPTFWVSTNNAANDGERTKRYMRNGEHVIEKVPQTGHVGDYDSKRRAPGQRYFKLINSQGNEISYTMTNAAAHMDTGAGYGQDRRRKARHFGWYAIGECPSALVVAGEINPDAFLTAEIREGQNPCAKGTFKGDHIETMCPHAKAERDARLSAHAKREAERAEKLKSKDDKLVEQQGEMLRYLAEQVTRGEQPAPAPRARARRDEE